jgi:hypothetical protein
LVSRKTVSLALLITAAVIVAACGSGSIVSDLKIQPSTITPDGNGTVDVAQISYQVSRLSLVSIYFVGTDGQRHYFRKEQRRSPGSYDAFFGGAIDGRVLPDGEYTCVIESTAEDGSNASGRAEAKLVIKDADTTPPQLQKFTVYPTTFTPNQDGINDRVAISYYLTKKAEVKVYLLDAKGNKYPINERPGAAKPGEPGLHGYDYDGGVDLGAMPPPDGTYTVVAEATDLAGNHVEERGTLTIVEGGVPRAEIVGGDAHFDPTVVPLGRVLTFTATVENTGTVPIRTKGPEPGFTYTTSENFSTVGQYEEPGIFRIGLDYEGNSIGRKYPYRWQLGKQSELTVRVIDGQKQLYIMPGQRVTITGRLQIIDKPTKVAPYYWIGLVHEQVSVVDDFIDPTQITIDF